jgi:hypothetical protein
MKTIIIIMVVVQTIKIQANNNMMNIENFIVKMDSWEMVNVCHVQKDHSGMEKLVLEK